MEVGQVARVSIILPTYNRLQWLREAVLSVQAQTFTDWDLLVVDDGSTDGTERWAELLADPRIRYQRVAHRGNIAAARNTGLDGATSDWTAFLDSDDRWTPGKLSAQLARLQDSPHALWCYGGFRTIDAEGRPVGTPYGRPWAAHEGALVDAILDNRAAVTIQTLLARTAVLARLRFDESIPLVDDYDLAIRLAAEGEGCVVDEVLAEIRLHPGRTTAARGYVEGYVGKIMTYRKAAATLPARRSRRLARRRQASQAVQLIGRAARRGDLLPLWHAWRRLVR